MEQHIELLYSSSNPLELKRTLPLLLPTQHPATAHSFLNNGTEIINKMANFHQQHGVPKQARITSLFVDLSIHRVTVSNTKKCFSWTQALE
jgi:hypothetical protein